MAGRPGADGAVASLSSTKGTPLSLIAPAGKAPLAVNRATMVKNLNAQFTGGLSSTQDRCGIAGALGSDEGPALPGPLLLEQIRCRWCACYVA